MKSTLLPECDEYCSRANPVSQSLSLTGGGTNLNAILKLLFFAEVDHLNRYGRPIVGDRYYARQWGPVPETTYDLLKEEPLLIQEATDGELKGRDTEEVSRTAWCPLRRGLF